MQVGKTEAMGTIDDNGVSIRDVDAILYYRGREEHVVVIVGKIKDDLFQFLWFHLSMSHSHTRIRHIFQNHLFETRQVVDTWIDEIHLSITRHLEINGIGYNLRTKGMNLRLYGISVGRWCLNNTQVASPHQRELQGARYGRSRHGECVNVGLQLA